MSPAWTGPSGPVGLQRAPTNHSGKGRSALSASERGAMGGLLALIFLEHLAFGGGRREVALAFSCIQALGLAALVLGAAWAREASGRLRQAALPAALYAAMFCVALLSLTPWAPGAPHPVWTYVDAAPAAAVDRGGVIVEIINLLSLACVFLWAWLVGARDTRARSFLTWLAAAFAAYAAWAFVAHLIDPQTIYGAVRKSTHDSRLTGSFFSSNTTASFLAIGCVILTASLVERLRDVGGAGLTWDRVLNKGAWRLAGLAFCVAALVLTGSRAGVTAGMVSLIVFAVWEALARRWRLLGPGGLGLAALIGLAAVLLLIGGTTLFERLLKVSDDADIRQLIAGVHWRAFVASPWMGYGLGSFDEINRLFADSATLPSLWDVRAVHNVYLQWLEEAGVLGAAPMFLCIAAILLVVIGASVRRQRMTTWLRAVVCASLALLIHGMTDFALQIPSISSQWACLLGLALAVSRNRER
jgi:O-antigen ligase